MAYGSFVLMRDLTFSVRRGAVFIIMGGSGSGKSTLLRHLLGLNNAAVGEIFYGEDSFTHARPEARQRMLRRGGGPLSNGRPLLPPPAPAKNTVARRRAH